MASSFVHTMRSLERRESWMVRIAPALLLLSAWTAWMIGSQVDVYASSSQARVEVSRMVHRVAAQEGGRLIRLQCELGQRVSSGQVLAVLDSSVEEADLALELAELTGTQATIDAVKTQIDAEKIKRSSRSRMDELSTERASLGLEQARALAAQQEALSEIARDLQKEDLNTRVEAIGAEGQLLKSRIAVTDAATEIERLKASHRYQDKADLARVAELERELARLEADQAAKSASAQRARTRIERRTVRSPANGRLGNIAALQLGDVVKAGDVLATIIPDDDFRVVAEFAPELAVGRIVPGLPARVRLKGFSWIEFGAIGAIVTDVASEPRDGTVRVELVLPSRSDSPIPVQHGLPGAVDVRIGQASPWGLLQRTVGSALARESAPPPRAALLSAELHE